MHSLTVSSNERKRVVLLMESVQNSPCGFVCECKESWFLQISGLKLGHFETPTLKTDILIFIGNKRLLV